MVLLLCVISENGALQTDTAILPAEQGTHTTEQVMQNGFDNCRGLRCSKIMHMRPIFSIYYPLINTKHRDHSILMAHSMSKRKRYVFPPFVQYGQFAIHSG